MSIEILKNGNGIYKLRVHYNVTKRTGFLWWGSTVAVAESYEPLGSYDSLEAATAAAYRYTDEYFDKASDWQVVSIL